MQPELLTKPVHVYVETSDGEAIVSFYERMTSDGNPLIGFSEGESTFGLAATIGSGKLPLPNGANGTIGLKLDFLLPSIPSRLTPPDAWRMRAVSKAPVALERRLKRTPR